MLANDLAEPLVLSDGTKINPSDGTVIRDKRVGFVEVPSNTKAQEIVARTRKTLAELPAAPKQLSGVALVAFYTLYGLSDQEIAIALDGAITVDQIKNIRTLDPYNDFMSAARDNILGYEQDTVRAVFAKNAAGAAMRVIELAESDNDVLAFKASQDILDRAGHRPVDVVQHKHSMEDQLNIVVVHKHEGQELPVIDITPNKVLFDDSNS